MIGSSTGMETIVEMVRLVGPRRSTVLITGETGTGKEVLAKAIHGASPRASRPMISFNCNALPPDLMEAELFGHVRGAFTGAVQARTGRFEQANGGTLFLDEIGDMSLETQAKLLRVLQEKEFQRLGSSENIRVDVRLIAATNADLPQRIREGRFREDLYYRLSVVPIELPPLRERREDIPLLVHHFLEKVCRQEKLSMKRVSHHAMQILNGYWWPGNVRQLENTVEMAVVLSGDREELYPHDFRLPAADAAPSTKEADVMPLVSLPESGLDFEATVSSLERNILEQALRRTRGNKKRAAEILGLKRTTLTAKLKSLGHPEPVAVGW